MNYLTLVQQTLEALRQFVAEHPPLRDGKCVVWPTGRPVALDVAEALEAIRRIEERL